MLTHSVSHFPIMITIPGFIPDFYHVLSMFSGYTLHGWTIHQKNISFPSHNPPFGTSPKWGYLQIIYSNRMFIEKTAIQLLGYPHGL